MFPRIISMFKSTWLGTTRVIYNELISQYSLIKIRNSWQKVFKFSGEIKLEHS